MVFLHFPVNYTDEEMMLQAKYAKLRKKKKALDEMKDPKPEPEKLNPLKRQLDPKDAKEFAKKLILSGKVNIKGKTTIEKTTFKRPRTLERKILSTGRSEGHGGLTPGYMANYPLNESVQYEPFTSNNEPGLEKTDYSHSAPTGRFGNRKASNSGSYSSHSNKFSSGPETKKYNPSSTFKDMGDESSSPNKGSQQNKPKRGPTIYVQAQNQNITESILKEHFEKFGKIVNLKLNNPSVGFITYEKFEVAELAIHEMNGAVVGEISYDVQFARRQPNISQIISDASVSASWTASATNQSLKSNFQDRRQQVVYDEP